MNFACDHCQRRYSIPDEKLRGKVVRVRCRNCQNPIVLRGEGSEAPDPASSLRPAPVSPPQGDWYVMIKGQQVGPLPEAAFDARIGAGEITSRSFVWRKGMAEWLRAETLDELRPKFGLGPTKPAASTQPEPLIAFSPSFSESLAGERNPTRDPRVTTEPEREPGAEPALAGALSSAPTGPGPEPVLRPEPALGPRLETQDFLFSELDAMRPGDRTGEPNAGVPIGSPRTDPSDVALASIGGIRPSDGGFDSQSTAHFPAVLENERRGAFRTFVKVLLTLVTVVALGAVGVVLLGLVPLEITRLDAQGREVRESVFARGLVPGLRDLLTGKTLDLPGLGTPSGAPPPSDAPLPTLAQADAGVAAGAAEEGRAPGAVDDVSTDAGVEESEDAGTAEVADGGEVRGDEEVTAALAPASAALEACAQAEKARAPDFDGAELKALIRVTADGSVASVRLDGDTMDASELGACVKDALRGLRLGEADVTGDARELEVPLTLSAPR